LRYGCNADKRYVPGIQEIPKLSMKVLFFQFVCLQAVLP